MKGTVLLLIALMLVAGCTRKKEAAKELIPLDERAREIIAEKRERDAVEEKPVKNLLGPMDSIKDLDRKVKAYHTGKQLTPQQIAENKKLKQEIIRGTFDLFELSRIALDVHWEGLANEKRKYFVNLLTDLLETKAIFSKEQVKNGSHPYKIAYKNETFVGEARSEAHVSSLLVIPSQKIDLNINYKMKQTPYGWKIYDVIVDDASLVENYKFQFNTIIDKHGYPELVARMEQKLEEMQK